MQNTEKREDAMNKGQEMMKYGAHIYVWTDRWSDENLHLMDRGKALGLDYLEISTGDDVKFTPRLTAERAESLSLEIVLSPGGLWPMDCDISSEDPTQRNKGLDWHRKAIDLAAEVGARAYTGAIYGHPGHVAQRRQSPGEHQITAENLHVLAQYAKENDVKLVLEPMSRFRTHVVNTPAQLMRLIEMSGHSNLAVLLDTYHMVTEVRDYARAVHTASERLWGIHACENDRGVPGGGLVPWQELFTALREVGFDGYVGLESYNTSVDDLAVSRGVFQDVCPDGDAFVRQGLAFLKDLVEQTKL